MYLFSDPLPFFKFTIAALKVNKQNIIFNVLISLKRQIMRIIAELPHPDFKISILSMNQKFIIKIEKGVYEQSYKIPEMDLTDGVNSVFEILDEVFLKTVGERFKAMHQDFRDTYSRYNF